MGSTNIDVVKEDDVMTLTLDRPEKKNAVTPGMYATLSEELDTAEDDEEVRVVVLRGAGGNLTSGNDLGEFQNVTEDVEEGISAYQFLKSLATFGKPLIVEVRGYAVGLGATMLLHADLVYAADDAQIKFPFVDLGVVPEAGSSLLLPMLAGYQRTAEIIFTADFVSAEEGRDVGFVNEVLPDGEVRSRVNERAEELAEKAPGALRETKRLLREPFREQLLETIDRETAVFHERLMSAEAMEALAAFMEGRDPDFSQF